MSEEEYWPESDIKAWVQAQPRDQQTDPAEPHSPPLEMLPLIEVESQTMEVIQERPMEEVAITPTKYMPPEVGTRKHSTLSVGLGAGLRPSLLGPPSILRRSSAVATYETSTHQIKEDKEMSIPERIPTPFPSTQSRLSAVSIGHRHSGTSRHLDRASDSLEPFGIQRRFSERTRERRSSDRIQEILPITFEPTFTLNTDTLSQLLLYLRQHPSSSPEFLIPHTISIPEGIPFFPCLNALRRIRPPPSPPLFPSVEFLVLGPTAYTRLAKYDTKEEDPFVELLPRLLTPKHLCVTMPPPRRPRPSLSRRMSNQSWAREIGRGMKDGRARKGAPIGRKGGFESSEEGGKEERKNNRKGRVEGGPLEIWGILESVTVHYRLERPILPLSTKRLRTSALYEMDGVPTESEGMPGGSVVGSESVKKERERRQVEEEEENKPCVCCGEM
ncbi:hypothetical protein M231_00481 [Tremella mesenterica]|uniref:Uncharacterized protein n=1 Tax=Tremella mesenterica TaxID=5217 RepID=A0A4Q1BVG2_TREME|nr:hypothetical protein M231_00481 [Tremella mesenterica]